MLKRNSPLCFFPSAAILIWALGYSCASLSANDSPLSTRSSPLSTTTINTILPADSAFNLSALFESSDSIVLMWDIKPGYYLYRKSLGISKNNETLSLTSILPKGEIIQDEFFGETEVYYDKLIIKLPYNSQPNQTTLLQLNYQGCAKAGYCYPMQQKSITLTAP